MRLCIINHLDEGYGGRSTFPLRHTCHHILSIAAVAEYAEDDGDPAQGQKRCPDCREDTEEDVPVEKTARRRAASHTAEKPPLHEGRIEKPPAQDREETQEAHDTEEDHAALPHGEAQMQVMHPAHKGSERGRFDAAALPRHKRVLLRRVGERRHAISAAGVRKPIDEKPALGIGGNRLHPAPGILALDPLQAL